MIRTTPILGAAFGPPAAIVIDLITRGSATSVNGIELRMWERSRMAARRYRSKLETVVRPSVSERFNEHVRLVNFSRARLFAGIIPLFVLVLNVPSDVFFLINGRAAGNAAYALTAILDAAAILLFTMFWLAMRRYERAGGSADAPLARFMVGSMVFLVLGLSIAGSILDQYLSGVITTYVIGIFGITITIYFTVRESVLVYPLPLLVFLGLLPLTRPEPTTLAAHATGAAEVAFVAWIVSRLLFAQKVREYNDRRTIERQAVEIQRTNDELGIANAALKQVNEVKSELINAATRDIKSPLLTIRGYAEVMKGEALTESSAAHSASHIHALATHVLNTITEILERAVSSTSSLDRPLVPVDLSELAASVMFGQSGRAQEKGQTLKAELQEGCVAMADQNWMREVVDHLLTNAIKYSPRDKRIFVTLKRNAGAGMVSLNVRDEGPGIPTDELIHIFDRAAKISTRPTAGEQSTRVGLWLVRQYVEAMKGGVRCESRVGEGTAFIVDLHSAER